MSLFTPIRYVPSVESIDLPGLWAFGKRAILLDRDNTLVPRDASVAPDSVSSWLEQARSLGFKLCVISNNWHERDIARSCLELGIDYHVSFACKPLPFALQKSLAALDVGASEAVLVGDQVYTDVCAGNLAKVETILVKPQSKVDMWYTHVFRIFERLALRGVPCEKGL